MLKLPKNVVSSPTAAAVAKLFTGSEQPLRLGGRLTVSKWSFGHKLQAALGQPAVAKHLTQSLEAAAKILDNELKGLEAVQKKAGLPVTERLSRLLLLTDDGSVRFYHDAESLVLRHAQRTWCVVLTATGEQLGQMVKPAGGAVKALLIADRKALEAFLLALV